MSTRLHGISSMAARALLAELAADYQRCLGIGLGFESVGGVDAARRVQAGEAFDLVVLAADAVDRLIAAGRVVAGSRTDLVHSGVAVAVRDGAVRPDIATEHAVRAALLTAPSIGYSTGPSGVALLQLLQRWGIVEALQGRLVQAPAGVPVAALVARGEVALGFQQFSELIHVDGITIVGPLPPTIQIVTTFSAGLCTASAQPAEVRDLLGYLASPATAEAKRRQGMTPA
jgi:molybdate transport system substrate-binding protein